MKLLKKYRNIALRIMDIIIIAIAYYIAAILIENKLWLNNEINNIVLNTVILAVLIYGGILAILILLVFLKSLKPTLVIAFSIPISLLFAIVLMYFSGVTLNIISLSGLALGVGMLVDNSIVVIENIS